MSSASAGRLKSKPVSSTPTGGAAQEFGWLPGSRERVQAGADQAAQEMSRAESRSRLASTWQNQMVCLPPGSGSRRECVPSWMKFKVESG